MLFCFDATSGVLSTSETVMMRDSVQDDTLEVMHCAEAMTANVDTVLLVHRQHLVQRLPLQAAYAFVHRVYDDACEVQMSTIAVMYGAARPAF